MTNLGETSTPVPHQARNSFWYFGVHGFPNSPSIYRSTSYCAWKRTPFFYASSMLFNGFETLYVELHSKCNNWFGCFAWFGAAAFIASARSAVIFERKTHKILNDFQRFSCILCLRMCGHSFSYIFEILDCNACKLIEIIMIIICFET